MSKVVKVWGEAGYIKYPELRKRRAGLKVLFAWETILPFLWGEMAKRTLRIDSWSQSSRLYFPERGTINKSSVLGRSSWKPQVGELRYLEKSTPGPGLGWPGRPVHAAFSGLWLWKAWAGAGLQPTFQISTMICLPVWSHCCLGIISLASST